MAHFQVAYLAPLQCQIRTFQAEGKAQANPLQWEKPVGCRRMLVHLTGEIHGNKESFGGFGQGIK